MGHLLDCAHRRMRLVALPVALVVMLTSVRGTAGALGPPGPVSASTAFTLPDLVPDVRETSVFRPGVFDEETQTFVPGDPVLHVDLWLKNLGSAALQLRVDHTNRAVTQCVTWRAERLCEEERTLEGFRWQQEDMHIDAPQFVSFELRKLLGNGAVDYTRRALIATGSKGSLCFSDSQRTLATSFPAPYYVGCTPIVQGVSAGWASVSSPTAADQQFSLAGLEDGRYALVVNVDEGQRLEEAADTNNILEAIVLLYNGVTQAVVVARNYPSSR